MSFCFFSGNRKLMGYNRCKMIKECIKTSRPVQICIHNKSKMIEECISNFNPLNVIFLYIYLGFSRKNWPYAFALVYITNYYFLQGLFPFKVIVSSIWVLLLFNSSLVYLKSQFYLRFFIFILFYWLCMLNPLMLHLFIWLLCPSSRLRV